MLEKQTVDISLRWMILVAHPRLGILLPCLKKKHPSIEDSGVLESKFSLVQIPDLDLTGIVLLNLD